MQENNFRRNKKIISPRSVAYEILIDILMNNVPSHTLLNELNYSDFEQRDKNLIRNIVLLTLKNHFFLEKNINQFIDIKKTPKKIKILLLMSLAQIYFLEKIPDYAVVNDAVFIAKSINLKFANLCNAVLRKLIKSEKVLITQEDQLLFLHYNYSWNKKIIEKLLKQYDFEQLDKILKDSLNKSKLNYRINTIKISFKKFVNDFEKKYYFQINDFSKNSIISEKPLINTDLFKEGLIIAQDPMSSKVVEILNPNSDDKVLDMCAAPGGKTTHISALMRNKGVLIACELKKNKIKRIEENIQRLGVQNSAILNMDALNISEKNKFSKILLDAPCSGWGVTKRKPEIKINYKPFDLKKNILLQEKLLEKAYILLEEGGELVYSTCTFNKIENEEQIIKFKNKYKDIEIIYQKQYFGFDYFSDYFFICKMRKMIKNERYRS
ncbi:16S rRNA (cytosine(967)-C(5))-methyltransferase RsmB [Spiroplasma endosymbiont of Amphibalanus improvisus]|uniref:16S rRNA (cytosine(967)-C(5))-methyltransferase RsmB n=1 Tax=Spiroplasma endosymbiont of Amphibalanus improvisus TaxID=3066327 RepID=UPI00313C26BB